MLLLWNCSARGRAHICLTPKNIPSVTGTCTNYINDAIMGNMLTPDSSCTLRSLRCERGRVAERLFDRE